MNAQTVNFEIQDLIKNLKSVEIFEYLNQPSIEHLKLMQYVIESKNGYDKALNNPKSKDCIMTVEENDVYAEQNYTELMILIASLNNHILLADIKLLHKLYFFHRVFYKTSLILGSLSPVIENPIKTNSQTPISKIIPLENAIPLHNNMAAYNYYGYPNQFTKAKTK